MFADVLTNDPVLNIVLILLFAVVIALIIRRR